MSEEENALRIICICIIRKSFYSEKRKKMVCLDVFLFFSYIQYLAPQNLEKFKAGSRTQRLAHGCGKEAATSEFSSSVFCVPHLRNGNGFFLCEPTGSVLPPCSLFSCSNCVITGACNTKSGCFSFCSLDRSNLFVVVVCFSASWYI